MTEAIHLGVLYGSTRPQRLCDVVADWTLASIKARGGFSVDPIDPATADVAAGVSGTDEAAREALRGRLGRADAFVVVVPEYNHSYPAPIKALIDSAKAEWQAKPVAFVSYSGGMSGGIRAVEHLRLVFTELHAVGIRDAVSFAGVRSAFNETGEPRNGELAATAMTTMLSRLSWWAEALRNARTVRDYSALAA